MIHQYFISMKTITIIFKVIINVFIFFWGAWFVFMSLFLWILPIFFEPYIAEDFHDKRVEIYSGIVAISIGAFFLGRFLVRYASKNFKELESH